MNYSNHAKVRSQQRGIPKSTIDLILQFGEPKELPGNAVAYRVNRDVIPKLQARVKAILKQIETLKDKTVVISDDNNIITVYHQKG